jgi:hypothetical protein
MFDDHSGADAALWWWWIYAVANCLVDIHAAFQQCDKRLQHRNGPIQSYLLLMFKVVVVVHGLDLACVLVRAV